MYMSYVLSHMKRRLLALVPIADYDDARHCNGYSCNLRRRTFFLCTSTASSPLRGIVPQGVKAAKHSAAISTKYVLDLLRLPSSYRTHTRVKV